MNAIKSFYDNLEIKHSLDYVLVILKSMTVYKIVGNAIKHFSPPKEGKSLIVNNN